MSSTSVVSTAWLFYRPAVPPQPNTDNVTAPSHELEGDPRSHMVSHNSIVAINATPKLVACAPLAASTASNAVSQRNQRPVVPLMLVTSESSTRVDRHERKRRFVLPGLQSYCQKLGHVLRCFGNVKKTDNNNNNNDNNIDLICAPHTPSAAAAIAASGQIATNSVTTCDRIATNSATTCDRIATTFDRIASIAATTTSNSNVPVVYHDWRYIIVQLKNA